MERQWEIVRAVLEAIETMDPFEERTIPTSEVVEEHGMKAMLYHFTVLRESGYIGLASFEEIEEAEAVQTEAGYILTLKGHELLDRLRRGEDPGERALDHSL